MAGNVTLCPGVGRPGGVLPADGGDQAVTRPPGEERGAGHGHGGDTTAKLLERAPTMVFKDLRSNVNKFYSHKVGMLVHKLSLALFPFPIYLKTVPVPV